MISYQEYFETLREKGIERYVAQFDNIYTLLQYQKVYEVTLRYLQGSDNVLDWGCGNGHFSYFLTSHGVSTTGYSFTAPPIYLQSNQLFTHVRGSENRPTELPFEDGQFDTVFSIGVLEHVNETGGDETESVKEIQRILKPGGRFISFHLPNRYQWIENVGRIVGHLEYFHRRKYDLKDIKVLLNTSDLHLEEWGRYGIIPRNKIRRLPESIKNSYFITWLLNSMDRLLSSIFPIFCTSYYFVALKKS